MATILFTWELGGGMGHCAILLPLIEGLIERGHAVYFAANDLATARQMCKSLDVKLLPTPAHTTSTPQIRLPRSFIHILHNTSFGDETEMEAHASAWCTLFDLVKPDVIVCEHAPAALLASRGGSARRVVIGTGFTVPPDQTPWPDLRPWLSAADDNLLLDENVMLRRTNEVLQRLGSTPLNRMADLYTDVDAQLLVTFRELDHYGDRPAAEYLGCWSPATGSLPEWPDGSHPRIFAYVKSYDPIWRVEVLLSVLRELQYSALVYVGGIGGGTLDKWQAFQTTRLRIVDERVDIGRLAATADAAILNGTALTTAELLRAGVPVMQIPVSLEQTILARRVAEMGAGIISDPQRPELLAVRVQELVSKQSLKDSASEFASKYAQLDMKQQATRGVNRVDDLAKRQVG